MTIASFTPFEVEAGTEVAFTQIETVCRACNVGATVEQIIGRATDSFRYFDGVLMRMFQVVATTEISCRHVAERRAIWVNDLKYKGKEHLFQSLVQSTEELLSSANSSET
jgi:hypothetical protein